MSVNPSPASPSAANPFSTRWIRPGAVPYLFPTGTNGAQLVVRLCELGWSAQILGEHGSGKSTLLQSLRSPLEKSGRRVELHVLHVGESRLPFDLSHTRQWGQDTQVIVDGYEQLGWYARCWLQRQCRLRNNGLLVTAHRPLRLPLLWKTESTLAVAQAVVSRLLSPDQVQAITGADVRRAYAACAGNLRETLFALYDVFEERNP
ncbi:MAG: hypothetical protein NTY19_40665 [Planctomycetota bacterium]|nr:hypothetical protein [Planctomycetota bacterium]